MTAQHRYCVFETAHGFCGIGWSNAGITRFQLPAKSPEAAERMILRRAADAQSAAPPRVVSEAVADVQRYFEGEATDFSLVELDLEGQEDFCKRAYAVAGQIKWGATTTYGAIAKELGGGPETARDVGQAMARNPIPLIVPCHRVLAAGGKIGGFSAPGGAASKQRMLELEGFRFEAAKGSGQASFGF
jgi:methylated-DNA-[protein]-cysteine S-methyltransferase